MKDINYYVYALIDPRDNKPFYIGKGKNSRVFSHEIEAHKNDSNEIVKLKTIHEIEAEGLEVIKEIIAYNCSEEEAFNIEDFLITFYRKIGTLTNIQSGHESKFSIPSEQWADILQKEKVEFDKNDKLILFKPSQTFDYINNDEERYEKFRGDWVATYSKAIQADYIGIVFNNVIKYIYKPNKWEYGNPRYTKTGRYLKTLRFEGEKIENHKYLNKSIKNVKKLIPIGPDEYEEHEIFGSGAVVGYINIY